MQIQHIRLLDGVWQERETYFGQNIRNEHFSVYSDLYYGIYGMCDRFQGPYTTKSYHNRVELIKLRWIVI